MPATSSSSSSRSSSKSSFRPCPKCPHRLSDFSQHEATPEPQLQLHTNTIIAEPTKDITNSAAQTMSSATTSEQWAAYPKTSRETCQEKCPENCTCPNTAVKSKEHTKTEQAKAWLETKEGQDHLKICIPSCPYKLLKAKLDAEANGEEVKKADAAAKTRADHLKICVASCPYRKTDKDDLRREACATAPNTAITHISIVEDTSTKPSIPELKRKYSKPTVEEVEDEGH